MQVYPRTEVFRTQIGERQSHVAQVTLGVNSDHRDTVDSSLFQDPNAQPSFAAARHTDDDCMSCQVFRLVENQVIQKLTLLRIISLSKVKHTELLKILHKDSPPSLFLPVWPKDTKGLSINGNAAATLSFAPISTASRANRSSCVL